MRIDPINRSGSVSSRGGVARGTGAMTFHVDDGVSAARVSSAAATTPAGGIEALLALQSVEDPLLARKKAVRRGNQLLDALERMKADLLVGQVSEGRLNQMMALILAARTRGLPGLDDVIDDIELRVRVELAKLGRYPAL